MEQKEIRKFENINSIDKSALIETLNELSSLIFDVDNLVSIFANTSSLLYNTFFESKLISWVGFYLYNSKNKELVLYPFMGEVACFKIPFGKGVCGKAIEKRETIVVENVHSFSGHIACDSKTNSEIVVPIIINDEIIGVLDVDSYMLNAFKEYKNFFESVVEIIISTIKKGEKHVRE